MRTAKLFGQPRAHDAAFYAPTTYPARDQDQWDDATAERTQNYADIAASVQHVTEETLPKMANYAYECTGLKRVCMAGGVALSSAANGGILRETAFEEVYIQPPPWVILGGTGSGSVLSLCAAGAAETLRDRACLLGSGLLIR